MHTKRNRLRPAALALLTVSCAAYSAHAQSADALIDKLVDKGILTVKEAKDLREEADKGFTSAYQAKSGMPDWVTQFKFTGDLRARYDGVFNPDPAPGNTALIDDRHRFRYRLRVGAIATIRDNFEVGFRLTSAEPQGTFGGDPISGNASFQDNGSKKFIYIDQAYAKWAALNTPTLSGTLTVGKMENPFVFSEVVFDPDYTPEGAAINLAYNITDAHTVKFIGGGFMLDELSNDANDPFLTGAQLRWDAAWTPKIQSSIGGALLSIVNAKSTLSSEGLSSSNVPDVNHGNSRTAVTTPAAANVLDNTFTTVVADASVTYNLESFPFYKAAFPIRVGAEYARNLTVEERNEAYAFGVTFGKSGKKGLWDVSYKYKELQGDFWFEELVDSDFGGFYQTASKFTAGTGYRPGTNLRGHVIKAQYSFFDSFTLGATAYIADVIDSAAAGPIAAEYDSQVLRVQLDAVWKF
ncbi:MAG TPA: putative porin [Verrucomicrobiae bacterium]|nr:putative porin [Verrucomicrobiae bacterium]